MLGLKQYLSKMEQYYLDCCCPFIYLSVFHETLSFWLQVVINEAYRNSGEDNCWALKAKAYKVQSIGASMLWRKNFAVQQFWE